ncbi:MAG: excinuclease ABC subunit C [Saprospiraceae bacterium]|nr:excinuclease ABC subunit C [Saprospiraceae bacterium]
MNTNDFYQISPTIPKEPGVYRFLDGNGSILYVGKAKNLKNRLSSYFGEKSHQAYKTVTLVRHAHKIEFTVVTSENDALLLENNLIKQHQPRYNVRLKDGKSYSYIVIKNEKFPRVFFTRKVIRDKSLYFGPYTSKYRVKVLLEIIKKIFPLRTCPYQLTQENIEKGKFKLCLEYHIKNCLGPCTGLENIADYEYKIEQIKNILKGHFKPVKEYIISQMLFYAEKMEFEKAHDWKEKLSIFEDYQANSTVVSTSIEDLDVFSIATYKNMACVHYLKIVNGALINTDTLELEMNLNTDLGELLQFSIPILRDKFSSSSQEIVVDRPVILPLDHVQVNIPKRGDKKKLLDLAHNNLEYYFIQKRREETLHKNKVSASERILTTLKNDLQMDKIPLHIECFDNSNIQGTNAVGACVVFKNAKPANKDYRHFKIKSVDGPNDFASMEEVVYRRYKRLIDEEEEIPQLIIIDGGKGQLSSAVKSLEKLDILDKVTVIGIAKKLEEIFFPFDSIPLYINKKSESLKLIQHARNEAHRFALGFHRDQRSKNFLGTQLTNIKGIGPKTADKLLKHFGSVEKIKLCTMEEISNLVGQKSALSVKGYFDA